MNMCFLLSTMNTLAESVTRFCNLRCALSLAGTSARWRNGSRDVVRIAGVIREIVRGGSAMESVESIVAMSTFEIPLTFAPMREISREDLMIRAAILLDSDEIIEELFALRADDSENPYARASRILCVRDFIYSLRGAIPTQNARGFETGVWKICLALIFMNIARPVHYELLDKYLAGYHDSGAFHRVLANILSSRAVVMSRVIECVMRQNLEDARECMPQMGDTTLKFLVSDGVLIGHHVMSFERAPQFAIDMKLRGHVFSSYQVQLFEQLPVESREFARCVSTLRDTCNAESINAVHIRKVLVSSAKNKDDRAFDIVYEMVRELREFCGVCDVIEVDEEFDVVLRAVRRMESKGMIVTFRKYIASSQHYGTIPRFANIARFIDLILARDIGKITGGNRAFQTEAIRFLARVLHAFGSHVDPVIIAHFADYPSILARIRDHVRDLPNEYVRARL